MDIIFFLLSLLINLVHPCRIKEFLEWCCIVQGLSEDMPYNI